MLIKEYRIPMPLCVDEYRIAQLYMIQKKSREESQGTESGVEIIENEPYTNGPGGNGQHTMKIYHISKHIPGWLVSLLPKNALIVEEEAWNAYPYTRTRYTCPFVEKFSIDIETVYLNDAGNTENAFDLTSSELQKTTVDVIDIVKEKSSDYIKDEDPKLYKSKVTGRGPLSDDWLSKYKLNLPESKEKFMCAYKRCKVEFKYWGMQSKIERFIHDTGLRKVMLRAHKQAWSWQDEWHGLTIDDIRKLEKETQLALRQKFGSTFEENMSDSDVIDDSCQEMNGHSHDLNVSQSNDETFRRDSSSTITRKNSVLKKYLTHQASSVSLLSSRSKLSNAERYHSQLTLHEGKIEGIRRYSSDDSSDADEFFDCQDELYDDNESNPSVDSTSTSHEWGSIEQIADVLPSSDESGRNHMVPQSSVDTDASDQMEPYAILPGKTGILFLVLHGGNALDPCNSDLACKQCDVQTLKSTFDAVAEAHYRSAVGSFAFRLVDCPPICNEAFRLLQNLNSKGQTDAPELIAPSSLIALFATSSPQYDEAISSLATLCNLVYNDFIDSTEGKGFDGQVCIISDTIGSIMAYDLLCRSSPMSEPSMFSSRRGSSMSNFEDEEDDHHLSAPNSPSLKLTGHLRFDSSFLRRKSAASALCVGAGLANSLLSVNIASRSPLQQSAAKLRKASSSSASSQRSSSYSGPAPSVPSPGRLHRGSQLSSSSSCDLSYKLEFEVNDLFMLGSPLAVVLAMRQLTSSLDNVQVRPACNHVYNIFYSSDPSSARIEPLLDPRFANLSPATLVKYRQFPLGNGRSFAIGDLLSGSNDIFSDVMARRPSDCSVTSGIGVDVQSTGKLQNSTTNEHSPLATSDDVAPHRNQAPEVGESGDSAVAKRWWGEKRIDYALFCPEALAGFPTSALPHLFHSSFWESLDFAAFTLRQVVKQDFVHVRLLDGKPFDIFTPTIEREKWLKRRTTVKLRNLTANHRAKDCVVLENQSQSVSGRFLYGPLDVVSLTGEKVDLYALTPPPSNEWLHLCTGLTNTHGKVTCLIPEAKQLGLGIYPIKMVVRGDHTSADSYLAVVPPHTDCVIFSIDGSFTASVSIMGSDPKVQPGAVDVVRHWQDLGYLIIYVTGRPDIQKHRVVTWLAQHNFPHGMIWFGDRLSHEPLKQKALLLKGLKTECKLNYAAAYGSAKDIQVYTQIGITPDHIYIIGKPSKKQAQQCNVINEGYSFHLNQLLANDVIPAAKYNAQLQLHKGCFDLPCSRKSRMSSVKKVSHRLSSKKQHTIE